MAEIVIQDCGCIAIPEGLAATLGMGPGTHLQLAVDEASRSITLTALSNGPAGSLPPRAACPIQL
jgi:hypothetical protein